MGASLEREPEAVHLDQERRPDPRTARTTNPTNQRRGTLVARWRSCLMFDLVRIGSGLGPDERLSSVVPAVDEVADCAGQVADRAEGAAADGLAFDAEPDS